MAELTTLSLAKQCLRITNTDYDTQLTALIESAEYKLRDLCSRPDGWLNTTAHTEKIQGYGFGEIQLIYSPVTAITSVKVFSDSASSVTSDSASYRIADRAKSILLTPSAWYGVANSFYADWPFFQQDTWRGFGYSNVFRVSGVPNSPMAYPYTEVVYTGGYANQAAIPPDLVQAANEMTAVLFYSSGQDLTLSSERIGDYQYQVSDSRGGIDHIKELLGDHIRVVGVTP